MNVRDKTFKVTELRGRWTDAADVECPCCNCYHPHDFGSSSQTIGYKIEMRCLTRELGQCPDTKPVPCHIYTKYGKTCRRCGFTKEVKEEDENG